MKDIAQLRKEINQIDNDLLQLLEKRYQVSKAIGEYKKASGQEIFVKSRELEILDKVGQNSSMPRITRNIFASIMRQSRQIQYQGLVVEESVVEESVEEDSVEEDSVEEESVEEKSLDGLDFIYQGRVRNRNLRSLLCLGPMGTNSYLMAKKFQDDDSISIEMVQDFEDVCQGISYEDGVYGVLPIENTTEGVVNRVYDLLVKHKLYIVDAMQQTVSHNLIGSAKDLEEITTIISHPQALGQCKGFISKLKVKTLECSSTAEAVARCVGNPQYAAIANEMCADIYGLSILRKDMNDETTNQTKFVLVSDRPHIGDDTKEFMLAFTLEHQSGSLSNTLQILNDYGLNMNSLVSRPVPDRPFEYRFYVSVMGDLTDLKITALMLQLRQELLSIQFLGNLS